jgi:hypothetical protein
MTMTTSRSEFDVTEDEFVSLHKSPPPITSGFVGDVGVDGPPGGVEEPTIFDDMMIDIETMSLHPHNALILSIGLTEFNPRGEELKLGRRLIITPEITPQLLLGRQVDASTQKFWAEQSMEASHHWTNPSCLWPLSSAATAIKERLVNAKRVWANGILFDLSNIVSLCAQVKVDTPWHYRAPRDMRTFCEEMPITKQSEIGKAFDFYDNYKIVPHDPVSDCIVQAYKVWQHWPRGNSR